MAKLVKITGINTVIRNITKAGNVLGKDIARGLKMGGLHLQAKSQEIVPVQLGDLHAAAFTRNAGGSGFDTDIIVGYGSEVGYAVYVHENLDAAHGKAFNVKYAAAIAAAAGTPRGTAEGGMINRGEKQQAKFLETPARTEKKAIIKIIQKEARIR